QARERLIDAYGPLFRIAPDSTRGAPGLAETVAGLASGTPYVLTILKAPRDVTLDWTDIGRALAELGGGRPPQVPDGDYVTIAGTVGRPATLIAGSNRPFRRSVSLNGIAVDVRMESWLA